MPIKAVIFDMDGVILDSMRYHVRAWQKVFKSLGIDISDHEVYAREGESWRKSTRDFLIMAGCKPSPLLIDKIFQERGLIFDKIFRPKVFNGAGKILKLLDKSGFKLGLVTATPRKDVNRMIPLHLLKFFSVTICGGDTKKGKPSPQPYLMALKKLKLQSDEAIVIENAPHGIRSAKSAHIRCIALSTSLPKIYLKEADMILDSLSGLERYFKGKFNF